MAWLVMLCLSAHSLLRSDPLRNFHWDLRLFNDRWFNSYVVLTFNFNHQGIGKNRIEKSKRVMQEKPQVYGVIRQGPLVIF
jgi:hypothetical protein